MKLPRQEADQKTQERSILGVTSRLNYPPRALDTRPNAGGPVWPDKLKNHLNTTLLVLPMISCGQPLVALLSMDWGVVHVCFDLEPTNMQGWLSLLRVNGRPSAFCS